MEASNWVRLANGVPAQQAGLGVVARTAKDVAFGKYCCKPPLDNPAHPSVNQLGGRPVRGNVVRMGGIDTEQVATKRLGKWWREARRRPGRLRPSHMPGPLRLLAVVTWAASGLALITGFDAERFSARGDFDFVPLWPLMCGIAIGSGAAAVAFVLNATRRDATRVQGLLAWCAAVAVPMIPLMLLSLNRSLQAIPVALAWAGVVVMVIRYVHVRRRAPTPALGLVMACLVASGWLPLVYTNIRIAAAGNGAFCDAGCR